MPLLTLTHASQEASSKLDVSRDKEVCIAVMAYDWRSKANKIRTFLSLHQAREGYPPMQIFPPHMLYQLSSVFGDVKGGKV